MKHIVDPFEAPPARDTIPNTHFEQLDAELAQLEEDFIELERRLSLVQESLDGIGLVLAMNNEDNRGWTRVLTPNGKLGFIHRNNLKRVK